MIDDDEGQEASSHDDHPVSSDDDVISNSIKRAFDQVKNEPLPDELQSLLEKLKSSGQN